MVRAADVVVTMGCGDTCPIFAGKRYLNWDLDDPARQSHAIQHRGGTGTLEVGATTPAAPSCTSTPTPWAWHPLATVQPGGYSDEAWTGSHCLTGDGRWAIAVIAPWHANTSADGWGRRRARVGFVSTQVSNNRRVC